MGSVYKNNVMYYQNVLYVYIFKHHHYSFRVWGMRILFLCTRIGILNGLFKLKHPCKLGEDPIQDFGPFAVIITSTHLCRLYAEFWSMAVCSLSHKIVSYRRPGAKFTVLFVSKVLSGVEFRVLCRSLSTFFPTFKHVFMHMDLCTEIL